MIAEIEKAKSSRSSCEKCKRKIEVGDLRGVDKYQSFGRIAKKYFCATCSGEILELCKVAIEEMLSQLK